VRPIRTVGIATMPRQTTFARTGDVTPQWHTVDASGQVLGRLATRVATILMGKHRPEYTPHVETGDYVIITNADKVVLTGRKAENKMRTSWSGYPSGLRRRSYGSLLEKRPEFVVEEAVRRMLPKSRLGSRMLKKLKVYKGEAHPHAAQQPQPMEA
jgi:large subunit ribosomal protein L13